jgi:hypothetical protein
MAVVWLFVVALLEWWLFVFAGLIYAITKIPPVVVWLVVNVLVFINVKRKRGGFNFKPSHKKTDPWFAKTAPMEGDDGEKD